jgi:hypothetical protein
MTLARESESTAAVGLSFIALFIRFTIWFNQDLTHLAEPGAV